MTERMKRDMFMQHFYDRDFDIEYGGITLGVRKFAVSRQGDVSSFEIDDSKWNSTSYCDLIKMADNYMNDFGR